MSEQTFWLIYGGVAALIVIGGFAAAGLHNWDGEEAAFGILATASMWPVIAAAGLAYCVLSWPYWLGVLARKHRGKLRAAHVSKAERIERDYEEVARMIQ